MNPPQSGEIANATFAVGQTIVTYTATNTLSSLSATCTFKVIVHDNEGPVITGCPSADVVVDAGQDSCGTKLSFPVTLSDLCTLTYQIALKYSLTGAITETDIPGPISKKLFPVGETTVTYTATDASNNETTCTFKVVVLDRQAPTALCKNATVRLDPVGALTITDYKIMDNGSYDNCTPQSNLTFDLSQKIFDCTDVGKKNITLTVTDQYNNNNTCEAELTVKYYDEPAPSVTPEEHELCSDGYTELALNNTGFENYTNWSWTVTPQSGDITGAFDDSQNHPHTINQQLKNNSDIAQKVTYTITPSLYGTQCTLSPVSAVVWVNPQPKLLLSNDSSICNDTQVHIPVSSSSVVSAGAAVYYDWTTAYNSQVDGYGNAVVKIPVGSGSVAQSLLNKTTSSQDIVYTFQPHLFLNGQYCASPHIATHTVTVQPTPALAIAATQDTICSEETIQITASTQNSLTKAVWNFATVPDVPSDMSVTGSPISVQGDFSLTLTNTAVNKQTTAYTFKPQLTITAFSQTCYGRDTVLRIVTNPVPVMSASFAVNDSICFDEGTRINLQTANSLIVGNMRYAITDVNYDAAAVEQVNLSTGVFNWQDAIAQDQMKNNSDNVQTVSYTFKPSINYNGKICDGKDHITVIAYIAPELKFDLNPKKYVGGWDISCKGLSDGQVTVINPRGGWPANGYDYVWNTGTSGTSSGLLAIGTYQATLTDKVHACRAQRSITLTEPNRLIVTANVVKPSCNGPTGSISLAATGGTRNYNYEWKGPEGYVFNDSSALNLRAGRYYITVMDANQCTADLVEELPVTGSDVPTVNWNMSYFGDDDAGNRYNISCYGAKDGSMNPALNVTSILVYTWRYQDAVIKTDTAVTFFNFGSFAINNLDAGNYRLSVIDDMGCLYECEVQTLKQPKPITFTSSVFQYPNGYEIECYDTSTGKITVADVAGGYGEHYGAFEYIWNPTDKGIVQGLLTQSNLYAGVFDFTVRSKRDRNLYCDTTASFTLRQPAGLIVQANVQQKKSYEIACSGQNSGTINVDITGNDSYQILWTSEDGVVSAPQAKDQYSLPAGTYVLNVTYGLNGSCTILETYTLHQPNEIKSNAVVSHITCYGDRNGKIEIAPEGGVSEFTYLWRSPDNLTIAHPKAQNQDQLEAGTYWLVITDANACVKTETFDIVEPVIFVSNIRPEDPSCSPGGDGAITLNPTGGTPGYTFLWSSGMTTPDIAGLSEGDYSVTITDAHGCTITEDAHIATPVNLQINANVTSNYNGYQVSCFGGNTGYIDMDILHGRPPYSYQWYAGGILTDVDPLNAIAGTFQVTVTDRFNCIGNTDVALTQPEKIRIQANVTDLTCTNSKNGEIQLFADGGLPPYKYSWPNGEHTDHVTGLDAGDHQVFLTDNNNCVVNSIIAVDQPLAVVVQFDVIDAYCPEVPDGEIFTHVFGGTQPYTYLWQGSDATLPNLKNVRSDRYMVEVTDAQHCTTMAEVTVGYRSDACLRIPNAFSPNADGTNDDWEITVGDPYSTATRYHIRDIYPDAIVEVYSANWGLLLYRSQRGYPEPWNGKYNGKYLPINSYVYLIRLNNDIKPIVGNVTIIR
jgi:gliding motility-associated-like protein